MVPRKVLWAMPDGATPVSDLDPTYHTLPKTKHTCELSAFVQVQAGERHVLEHLDIACEHVAVVQVQAGEFHVLEHLDVASQVLHST